MSNKTTVDASAGLASSFQGPQVSANSMWLRPRLLSQPAAGAPPPTTRRRLGMLKTHGGPGWSSESVPRDRPGSLNIESCHEGTTGLISGWCF